MLFLVLHDIHKFHSVFLLKNYLIQYKNLNKYDYVILFSRFLIKLLHQYIHNEVIEFFPIIGILGDSCIKIEDWQPLEFLSYRYI